MDTAPKRRGRIALAAALVVFLHKEEHKTFLRLTGKRWPLRLLCLGAGLLCLTQLFPTQKLERFSVKTDVWDPAGSYRTGGCLAAFLAQGGKDVSLIARGAHLEAIQKNGLVLETGHGTFAVPVRACEQEQVTR